MILAGKAFFIFLLFVLLGYHLLRGRSAKYRFLLAASWLFYAWAAPQYLAVLLGLTVIDYCAGLKIEASTDPRRRRRWLTLSIVSNLGLLGVFKYTTFVYDTGVSLLQFGGYGVPDRAWDILLPLGISFHTFQGISYTVDVYRGQVRAVRNFRDYALFVAFFPQLAAGPIVRAVEFLPQMATPPRVTSRQIADGLHLFILGLFKKLLIADQLDQMFVSPVFANPEAFDAGTLRWAVIAWAVQIYCDFSGYTDIALGTAKWFGFELPPNFQLPYLATSIADFWRRWHLSLSTWLRDYLYFPLGGSRGSTVRTYCNLMVIFVLCGLWHGAEWRWVVYGVFNGVLMGLHRSYDRAVAGIPWLDRGRRSLPWTVIAWMATMAQLLFGLILIRMESWSGGITLMVRALGWESGLGPTPTPIPPLVPVLIAVGLAGHVAAVGSSLWGRVPVRVPDLARGCAAATAVVLLVVFAPGVGKTFLYMQF
ncbi:MAG: MBOAT family protein [Bacteroidales bacterium]|nr:MBOAT family protein [Bacteroidales bacterium]